MKNRLLALLLALLPLVTWGQGTVDGVAVEPYVVFDIDDNSATMTFYYDGKMVSHQMAMSLSQDGTAGVPWANFSGRITSVVFDKSFANYTSLSSTANWFAYCEQLSTITGLENLKTDGVKDMNSMFTKCTSLTSLDLSGFNTAQVTNMDYMFSGCSGLTTIYAGSDWTTSAVTSGIDMFSDCTKLVGGAGTVFSPNRVDYTFACIDGGPNSRTPGYFTAKSVLEPPTFRFDGDNLVMETTAEDASIFYQMADLPDMDDATIEKISSAMTVTANVDQSMLYEQPIELKKSVVLKAIAAGATESEPATLVYDYNAWYKLLEAIQLGNDIWEHALDNDNVPLDLKDSLIMVVSQGQEAYDNRAELNSSAAEHATQRIFEFVDQVEKYLKDSEPEPYAVLSENNTVLTFYYDGNKADRNGMDVVSPNAYLPWYDQRESITKVVFDDSFANCLTLTSTANWFEDCSKLTTIIGIENLKTDNVTYMGGMFYGCSGLSSLDVSGFKTDNVTDMSRMFSGCSGLTSLDVSGFKTDNVTNMGSMFWNCSGLTKLNVSGIKTDNVTNMAGMFSECSGLSSLDVSHFNTEKVTNMNIMFSGCSGLSSLDLSSFKTDNVMDMSNMFSASSSLTTLDVSGFKTDKVTNMKRMFSYCSGLLSLDVSGFKTDNVTDMSYMFESCSNLTSLDVSGFKTDNVTDMSNMFSGCSGLTSLDVSGFKTDNVTDMCNMFSGCSGLTSLDVSGFKTDNVTNMGSMFRNCSGLTKLNVSGIKTDNVTDMSNMFSGCSGLTSLDVSGFKTDNVTNMLGMFGYCYNLETIYSGTDWSTAAVKSGNYVFLSCTKLVGGKGTIYDNNHIDYTYARIDGGPNSQTPGYFTDKNAVEPPTFRFDGENLVISTETTSAKIFYQMADLPDMDDATIEKISSGLTVTADAQQSILYEKPIELKKSVVLKAIAVGAVESEVSTLVYDYDAWQNLLAAVWHGNEVLSLAENNDKVPSELKERLAAALETGMALYADRAVMDRNEAIELTRQILDLCNEIEWLMNFVDATFDSYGVLTIGSGTTMTDALEKVGGRAEVAKTITAIVWNNETALTNGDLQGLDNPNMLIYVADESLVPANRNNVVVGDIAKSIVLTDVVEGNGNFYCPKVFRAQKISYSHEYNQKTEIGVARGWESIALPFRVQTITHETKGLIAPFGNDASNKHFWLRQLSENGLMRATVIEPNTAYLISMPNNEAYPAASNLNGRITFSSEDIPVPVTQIRVQEMRTANGDMVVLLPSFQSQASTERAYALNVGEERDGYAEGSIFLTNYRQIRPFEAFTVHEGNGPAPQFISILDLNGGNTTGIESLTPTTSPKGDGSDYFTLDGRKLQNKPAKKGVFIRDGKKIVVK